MLGRCLCSAVLCLFAYLAASSEIEAQQLACNSAPIRFNEPLENSFVIADLSDSGVHWGDRSDCGLQNFTGGFGNAACLRGVSGAGNPIDTTLTTLAFDISCQSNILLNFQLSLRHPNTGGSLRLEVSSDDGLSWSEIWNWEEDVGPPFAAPGQMIEIDLSPFSFPGASLTRLRWHYLAAAGSTAANWYAQIDTISLTCTESPRADLTVQMIGSAGPVFEGDTQRYSYIAHNSGPADASNFQLNALLPNGVQLVSASVSSGTLDLQGRFMSVGSETLPSGSDLIVEISTTFAGAATGAGPQSLLRFDSSVQSDTCDLILNNNVQIFDVTVLRDRDGDGIPDVADLCPFDSTRSDPGFRGCSAKLPRIARQTLRSLDRMLRILNKIESGNAGKKHELQFKRQLNQFSDLTRQSSSALASEVSLPALRQAIAQYRQIASSVTSRKIRAAKRSKKLAEKIEAQIVYG
ncbi:MAG: DUF11 domain-containing protein [Deltaproteobacteria bacterium]|nr:DUF11 domain-containing protein [Deltaproteobacteria bacterium]